MLIFFLWAHTAGFSLGVPLKAHWIRGLLFCGPLIAFNLLLFGPWSQWLQLLRPCHDFKVMVVKPLAEQLNVLSSFFVALAAGLGEELFFRGVLQNEIGLILSSFAFCFLHFGFAITRYVFIGGIYMLIGVYFGVIYETSHSLWPPIVTHTVYDFLALLYMRYWFDLPAE